MKSQIDSMQNSTDTKVILRCGGKRAAARKKIKKNSTKMTQTINNNAKITKKHENNVKLTQNTRSVDISTKYKNNTEKNMKFYLNDVDLRCNRRRAPIKID